METTIYSVRFNDGREYRVFCANKSQKQRFLQTTQLLTSDQWSEITNGIHTIKQFEDIINAETNQ